MEADLGVGMDGPSELDHIGKLGFAGSAPVSDEIECAVHASVPWNRKSLLHCQALHCRRGTLEPQPYQFETCPLLLSPRRPGPGWGTLATTRIARSLLFPNRAPAFAGEDGKYLCSNGMATYRPLNNPPNTPRTNPPTIPAPPPREEPNTALVTSFAT
ncbi:hypothetical protein GCM10009087_22530 [Sphingomonas oligophenolica]